MGRCTAMKPNGRSKVTETSRADSSTYAGRPTGAIASAVTAAARNPTAVNSATAPCRACETASG